MGKKPAILALAFFISLCSVVSVFAASKARERALQEGFILTGVDGKLLSGDSNDGWFFEFDSDVSDSKGRVHAGASLKLLPSAGLEKMVANAAERSNKSYRLWARVTKYRDENFIFPIYFLPISQAKLPKSQQSQSQEVKVTINEPNDELAMPERIVAKLKTRKIVRTEQLKKGLELKSDSILADRTGTLVEQADGGFAFVLDALGWDVPEVSFPLLPCWALEYALQKQSAELEQLRFKISGILTNYKGRHYLLLQRARRVYSHQNFGR